MAEVATLKLFADEAILSERARVPGVACHRHQRSVGMMGAFYETMGMGGVYKDACTVVCEPGT